MFGQSWKLLAKFHLLRIRTSTCIDIFSTLKCKVTVGLKYIIVKRQEQSYLVLYFFHFLIGCFVFDNLCVRYRMNVYRIPFTRNKRASCVCKHLQFNAVKAFTHKKKRILFYPFKDIC